MEEKIESAKTYVRQIIAYHEQCGETPDIEEIINDAANIFADTYEEYCAISNAL